MIEFLAPRDGAFGESDAADFVGIDGIDAWGDVEGDDDGPPRPRWLTTIAVLGLAGLFAGGIIAAAPWSDDTATPVTSVPTPATVAPPSTAGNESTTSRAERRLDGVVTTPSGWVLDEPGPFLMTGAWSNGTFVGPGDAFHLWRDDVASRTTGAFVAIDSNMLFDFSTIREDGVRITAGDRPALVWTAPDGVIELQVVSPDDRFTLTSGGVALDRLIELAATITVGPTDRTAIDYHGLDTAAGGPLAGLTRTIEEAAVIYPGSDLGGTGLAGTSYLGPGSQRLELRLMAGGTTVDQISDLVLSRPLPDDAYGPDDAETIERFALTGRPVSVHVATSGSEQLIGRMRLVDGTQLVVIGSLSLPDLLDVLGRVRPASDVEWRAVLLDSLDGFAIEPESGDVYFAPATPATWSAVVVDGWFHLSDGLAATSMPFAHGAGPELRTYCGIDSCFLRATTTAPDVARSIVLAQPGTRTGAEPVQLDLHEVEPGVFVAVTSMETDAAYTVQWLDADGAPVPGPEVAGP